MRLIKILITVLLLAFLVVVGRPVVFLASAWWRDGAAPLPVAAAGTNDASRLNANQPAEVIAVAGDPAEAEQQLVALVRRAREQHLHISISGAHHSMGGHTF